MACLAHLNQIAETSSTVICSPSLTSAFLTDSFSNLTPMLVNGQFTILFNASVIYIFFFTHADTRKHEAHVPTSDECINDSG